MNDRIAAQQLLRARKAQLRQDLEDAANRIDSTGKALNSLHDLLAERRVANPDPVAIDTVHALKMLQADIAKLNAQLTELIDVEGLLE